MHAPNPINQELFFSLPVVAAPVQTHIVTPPVTTMGEDLEPAHRERTEPVVEHEREQQQPNIENVPETEALRRSKRTKRLAISSDYVCNTEIVHMKGDPTSYEEAMRSPHSSKWIEAMEDEMKLMSSNHVWDLKEIPKGAKTVGCKWVYKTKYDSN